MNRFDHAKVAYNKAGEALGRAIDAMRAGDQKALAEAREEHEKWRLVHERWSSGGVAH